MNGAGVGYLSGNMLVPFPFEDGQTLEWSDPSRADELQAALQSCFVDAGVSLSATSVEAGEWPSIGEFSLDGGTLSFTLSASGAQTRLSASGSSTTRFPIISGTGPWGSYVIVLSSKGISGLSSISPSAHVSFLSFPLGGEGTRLRLCAKCVTLSPAALKSIQVWDGVHDYDAGPHFTLSGDVSVRPGHNMLISEGGDPSEIELNADPGAGLGVLPCSVDCEDDDGLLIGGSDGHVRLFNDTCYDLEPSSYTGVISVHAKCTACCTCGMYESIVEDRLAVLADAVRAAKREIDSMHQAYESAVKKFNERITRPIIEDVSLTLSGMPIGARLSPKISNEDVKGRMERCVFTATVVNSSYFDLTFKVSSLNGTDYVAEASAAWSDAGGAPLSVTGDGPGEVVSGTYVVCPGRSLVVTFVAVKGAMVSRVVTGGYTGSISVEVSWSEGFLGSISQSASV